jgi:hypothetical protein
LWKTATDAFKLLVDEAEVCLKELIRIQEFVASLQKNITSETTNLKSLQLKSGDPLEIFTALAGRHRWKSTTIFACESKRRCWG